MTEKECIKNERLNPRPPTNTLVPMQNVNHLSVFYVFEPNFFVLELHCCSPFLKLIFFDFYTETRQKSTYHISAFSWCGFMFSISSLKPANVVQFSLMFISDVAFVENDANVRQYCFILFPLINQTFVAHNDFQLM